MLEYGGARHACSLLVLTVLTMLVVVEVKERSGQPARRAELEKGNISDPSFLIRLYTQHARRSAAAPSPRDPGLSSSPYFYWLQPSPFPKRSRLEGAMSGVCVGP